MDYGILTIDTPVSNRGNRLIEYALKIMLGLDVPKVVVSMFRTPSDAEIERLNQCEFVLLPGSTILAIGRGQGEAMSSLGKIMVPKFCIGASYWGPRYTLNTSALKHIDGPIGARDPLTQQGCDRAGKSTLLTGCPTALVPLLSVAEKMYQLVGFARTHMQWQIAYFKSLSGHKVVALQEPSYEAPYATQCSDDIFTYDDPEVVMQTYAEAKCVHTGRLHGLLPALSQQKTVTFIGDVADSRFSLLDMLGIPINPLGGSYKTVAATFQEYKKGLFELEGAFKEWRKQTIGAL